MELERKHVEPMIMLEAQTCLSLGEIPGYAERIVPELLAEADARELMICGPCMFSYQGCDGNPETEVTLRVGFPVLSCQGVGVFACTEVPAHECVCSLYRGSMRGIGAAWTEFTFQARELGYALGNVGREVYVHWVGLESPDNLTELQLPLK